MGQVIEDNKFRQMSFGYDANGRMVRAARANSSEARSVYDGLGNRVGEKVGDEWRFLIYDAFGKLVAEYEFSANGPVAARQCSGTV
ncbi:MAG: hypothetical protein C4287_23435, partial [Leptolyngbya sp. ERB_1_2]